MDPNSAWSKMDSLTKSLIALLIALTLCVGFLINRIGAEWFASIATFVLGAIFGRTMGTLPSAITKTTEVAPDGTKKETSISAPLGIPPTPPPPNGGTTT